MPGAAVAPSRLSALSPLLRLLRIAPLHPVADGGLGEDVDGVVRVVAQLEAQSPDDVSHRRGVLALVRSPDPLQQMLVGQRPPGVGRKLDQHPILDAGERDGASRHCHPALGIVDGQVSPHIGLCGLGQLRRRPLAQGRPDPGRQLRREKGLTT